VIWFDQVSLSDEDRKRADLYRQQRQRHLDQERFATLEEFLASLGMTAEVGGVSDTTLARVAQLIGKTNQFNLTTRRHSAAEIAAMAADPSHAVAWLRLVDRFGDQGLVAVAILRREAERAIIDTFLMSCRVMNRGVEQALAAYLVEHARRLGCREILGEYLPTKKNAMVRGLYPTLGFTPVDQEGRWFVLNLGNATVEWPAAIGRKGVDTPVAGTG
jgi:FkbH-like protein